MAAIYCEGKYGFAKDLDACADDESKACKLGDHAACAAAAKLRK